MSVGNAYKNVILDSQLGDDHADIAPDDVYLALFTSAVGDDASGDEVGASDYVRIAIPNTSEYFPAASSGQKSLAVAVSWPVAEEDWGVIGWWALFDDEEDGNLMFWGRGGGGNPPLHLAGSTFLIPADTLTIESA